MPITGTSDLDDILPKFISAVKFRLQAEEKAKPTVRTETLGKGQGDTFNIPLYGQFTARALTEKVDNTDQQVLTDSNLAINPSEIGVNAVVTRLALRRNKEPVLMHLRRIMTDALTRKKDQDIFDDAANFSNSRGSAGSALSTEFPFAAGQRIRAVTSGNQGGPAPDPHFFWVHPNSLYDILSDVEAFSSNMLGTTTPLGEYAASVFQGGVGILNKVAGLTVVESPNINVDSNDDADNAVLSKEAIVLVEEGGPEWATEPDVSLRGLELNIVQSYQTGEYADGWGARIIADAVAL